MSAIVLASRLLLCSSWRLWPIFSSNSNIRLRRLRCRLIRNPEFGGVIRRASEISSGAAKLVIAQRHAQGSVFPRIYCHHSLSRDPRTSGAGPSAHFSSGSRPLAVAGQNLEEGHSYLHRLPRVSALGLHRLWYPGLRCPTSASIPSGSETQFNCGKRPEYACMVSDRCRHPLDGVAPRATSLFDRFGVWSPVIDYDKEITAVTVRGLDQSCLSSGSPRSRK